MRVAVHNDTLFKKWRLWLRQLASLYHLINDVPLCIIIQNEQKLSNKTTSECEENENSLIYQIYDLKLVPFKYA